MEEVERKKGAILSVREALSSKKGDSKDPEFNYQETDDHSDEDADDGDEAKFDARMRSRILRKRMEMGDITTSEKLTAGSVCFLNCHFVFVTFPIEFESAVSCTFCFLSQGKNLPLSN